MSNPEDTGLFEGWITNRESFQVIPPQIDDTGNFERWVTNRIYFHTYLESALLVNWVGLVQLVMHMTMVHKSGMVGMFYGFYGAGALLTIDGHYLIFD